MLRQLQRLGLTRKSLNLTIWDAPSELDEVGVPKPFAIIEKGNDLGSDPDQEETFFSCQCVSQDLGKLPEHKLAHAIDLIGVSHWLRRATYGQTTDLLPVEIGECNRERDLVVVRYVLRLLGFSRAPEIHSKAVAHVAHRRRVRIAIWADSRDGHIACTFKNREDLLSQGGVHFFTSEPKFHRDIQLGSPGIDVVDGRHAAGRSHVPAGCGNMRRSLGRPPARSSVPRRRVAAGCQNLTPLPQLAGKSGVK